MTLRRRNATAARQQLDRIIHSRTFRHFDRLRHFLVLLVHESLVGHAERLTEAAIAERLFDREPSFDPERDPIMRVQKRQLQRRLADYYAHEGAGDEVLISVPDTGFLPVLTRRLDRPAQTRTVGRRRDSRH